MSEAGGCAGQKPPIAQHTPRLREWGPVGMLALLAFVLHLSQLHQSLLGDEGFTYQDVVGRSLGSVLTNVHTSGENSPPLFFALAWAAGKLGDPSVWIRLPSVILSAATVPVIYALGRVSVGRVAALAGAALYAISPFMLFYGVEARPYATMMFCVAVSTYGALQAVRTRRLAWWVVYTLGVAGAAYSHYTSIFVLGVQAAWSLWACRARPRQPLVANAVAGLLYLPWLPHVRGKALSVIGGLAPLSVHSVLADLVRVTVGHPSAGVADFPTYPGLIAILVAVAIGAAFTLRGGRAGGPRPGGLRLLVVLAAATPVGLLLYSLLGTDLWLPRGLSASLPAAALVAGALVTAPPPRVAVVCLAAMVTVLALGTIKALEPRFERGPYRAVAHYLDRVAGPHDPVLYLAPYARMVIDEQYRRPHLILEQPRLRATLRTPGAHAFLVIDDTLARYLRIGTPALPGWRPVARRHFDGFAATDVWTFSAAAART